MYSKVPPEKLKIQIKDDEFLKDTSKIPSSKVKKIICQEKALEEIMSGLRDCSVNANILLSGNTGVGKSAAASTLVEEWCKSQKPHNLTDKVLLYNFENPKNPIYVALPAGEGRKLKKDLEACVEILKIEITGFYDANITPSEVVTIKQSADEVYIQEFKKYFPDSQINPRDAEAMRLLSKKPEALKILNEIATDANKKIGDAMQKYRTQKERDIISKNVRALKMRYAGEKLSGFFDMMEKDICGNVALFDSKKGSGDSPEAILLNINMGKDSNYTLRKYLANLQVDHSRTDHIPFKLVENPSLEQLVGRVNNKNPFEPEHFRIEMGDFVRYDKGILLFDEGATFLLSYPTIARFLTVCETKKMVVGEEGFAVIQGAEGIETGAVDADFKIVMNLNERTAHFMEAHHPEFMSRFHYKACFDPFIENTKKNRVQLFEYVANEVNFLNQTLLQNGEERVPHFSNGAVVAIIENMARQMSQEYLMFNLREVNGLLKKAAYRARTRNSALTEKRDVAHILEKERDSLYQKWISKQFKNGGMPVTVTGSKVGQINGLAVAGEIGYPLQIQVTSKKMQKGLETGIRLSCTEEGSNLSGKTWNKGLLLANTYLDELLKKYKKEDIGADITVSVPGSWGGVDGPSASAAITYAILSSLSGIPIRQNIGVTGALKSNGDITVVGGLNEKIEGAYHIMGQQLGKLDGNQGVLIPHSNIINCNLHTGVLDDIKNKKFSVFSYKHVRDGFSLLMNTAEKEIVKRIYQKFKIKKSSTATTL